MTMITATLTERLSAQTALSAIAADANDVEHSSMIQTASGMITSTFAEDAMRITTPIATTATFCY